MSWRELCAPLFTWDTARWIFLFPVLIIAWHCVLLVGILFATSLDHFCDPDDMVSGLCTAQWYSRTVRGLTIGFSGLSAVAVVAITYLMSPRFKPLVMWIVFGLGSLVAVIMAAVGNALMESVCAILCGWLAARLCARSGIQ